MSAFPPGPGLAYCRHLSTVRTHLSALVNHMIVSPDLPCDAGQGLTASIWEQYIQDSTVSRAGLVHQRAEWRQAILAQTQGPRKTCLSDRNRQVPRPTANLSPIQMTLSQKTFIGTVYQSQTPSRMF